jgi:hypothetical protein
MRKRVSGKTQVQGMPLSDTQRRRMDIHIQAHTAYNWPGTGGENARTYVVDCMERLLDSPRSMQRDLFLPHALVNEHEHENFWFKMALELGDMVEWHELETKGKDGRWRRYVYTWRRGVDRVVFRVYLRRVRSTYLWYGSKCLGEAELSGDDTDHEETT